MNSNGYMSSICTLESCEETKWDISHVLTPDKSPQLNYAVLILNRPITQDFEYMVKLWNGAAVRITVDGGTRRWDTYINNLSNRPKDPDLVTGDFDSITEEILEKYKSKGCKIIHTPDQNFTDFTKALIELNIFSREKNVEIHTVIVNGQTSGRLDQIMGNIQTLFMCKEKQLLPPKTNVFLISDDSLSWLLYPGNHSIDIPDNIRSHKKPWCSLVPIGEKCEKVTTTGLKWNLENDSLKFGDLVSTSNTYSNSPTVKISCSHPLLWSMKVPSIRGTLSQ